MRSIPEGNHDNFVSGLRPRGIARMLIAEIGYEQQHPRRTLLQLRKTGVCRVAVLPVVRRSGAPGRRGCRQRPEKRVKYRGQLPT